MNEKIQINEILKTFLFIDIIDNIINTISDIATIW